MGHAGEDKLIVDEDLSDDDVPQEPVKLIGLGDISYESNGFPLNKLSVLLGGLVGESKPGFRGVDADVSDRVDNPFDPDPDGVPVHNVDDLPYFAL